LFLVIQSRSNIIITINILLIYLYYFVKNTYEDCLVHVLYLLTTNKAIMFSMDEEDTSTIQTNSIQRLVQSSMTEIEKLYKNYEHDLFMTSKIHHYITEQLPTLMKNVEETRNRNKQRNMEHQHNQDKFMSHFLDNNRYYYNITNEQYFHYDGSHYSETSEEIILHHILSTISEQKNDILMNRKYQTKVMLLKRIKDQSILKAIPDSNTIQRVIQYLCPMIFSTKTETKYFLTILGDNLMKKQGSNTIHYISPNMKNVLASLNRVSVDKLHNQCTLSFKHKYHEKHEDCNVRLVKVQPHGLTDTYQETWDKMISYGMDVLCVACHYSRKYGSSDDYVMEYSNDHQLQEYVFRLQQTQPIHLISQFAQSFLYNRKMMDKQQLSAISASPQEEQFLQEKLQKTSSSTTSTNLSWTHIQYLWKTFLQANGYPHCLYYPHYKTILIENVFPGQYNSETDSFEDVGSSQWPMIQNFLKFWDETTIQDPDSDVELEADEIALLFRKWMYRYLNLKHTRYLLKDTQIIDILNYFYVDLEIVENKYVLHVQNTLWDKDMDIELAINQWREAEPDSVFSVHHVYSFYAKYHYCNGNQEDSVIRPLLVSKSYFEKYCRRRMLI